MKVGAWQACRRKGRRGQLAPRPLDPPVVVVQTPPVRYTPTDEGFLYLAGVMDAWSRSIVGWSMSNTLHATIATDALTMAVKRRSPPIDLKCNTPIVVCKVHVTHFEIFSRRMAWRRA
jgi:transposase InsO family protein